MHHENISEMIFERAARGLSHYYSTLPLTDTEKQVNDALQQFFTPFMDGDGLWNHQAFHGVMSELLKHSLVEFDHQTKLYSVLPSYHAFIREKIHDQELTCRCAIRLLATSIDPQTSPEERIFRQIVIVHVDKALFRGSNINMNDAIRFALAYSDCGRWPEAELLQTEVFELNRELLGESHPSTIESMQRLVDTYEKQGKGEAARSLLPIQSRNDVGITAAGQISRVGLKDII